MRANCRNRLAACVDGALEQLFHQGMAKRQPARAEVLPSGAAPQSLEWEPPAAKPQSVPVLRLLPLSITICLRFLWPFGPQIAQRKYFSGEIPWPPENIASPLRPSPDFGFIGRPAALFDRLRAFMIL